MNRPVILRRQPSRAAARLKVSDLLARGEMEAAAPRMGALRFGCGVAALRHITRILMRPRLLHVYTAFFSALVFSPAAALAATNTFPRPRDGWSMQLVAEAPLLRHPSVVCAAPDGRVFVAEDPMDISSAHAHVQEGRIVCLHPDGHTTAFATNSTPQGCVKLIPSSSDAKQIIEN